MKEENSPAGTKTYDMNRRGHQFALFIVNEKGRSPSFVKSYDMNRKKIRTKKLDIFRDLA